MPCKPRMRGCRVDCLHRQLVEDYRAERERAFLAMEAVTALHPAEVAEYLAQSPLPTFAGWLRWHARHDVEVAA